MRVRIESFVVFGLLEEEHLLFSQLRLLHRWLATIRLEVEQLANERRHHKPITEGSREYEAAHVHRRVQTTNLNERIKNGLHVS